MAATDGFWGMIISRPPTKPSPPHFSIHWMTPAKPSDHKGMHDLEKEYHAYSDEWGQMIDKWDEDGTRSSFVGGMLGGVGLREDNFAQSAWLTYKGERIRVFQREYKAQSKENMALWVFGDPGGEPSHDFVPLTSGDKSILKDIKEGERRTIYDAALVDGCTHEQAQMVAMEFDIDSLDFPPIGWYRCKPEYALIYCYPEDIDETDDEVEEDMD